MKHINLSELWKFSLEPFPAFRCDIKLGIRRQREEFALLPVLGGLIPGRHYETFEPGSFKVIKSQKKGTWLIVPNNDENDTKTINDLLLFKDFNIYFGDVSIINISAGCIRIASADSIKAKQKKMAVAITMKPGSWFAAEFSGRHDNRVEKHVWDGKEISIETFSPSEWNPPDDTRTWRWAWELG